MQRNYLNLERFYQRFVQRCPDFCGTKGTKCSVTRGAKVFDPYHRHLGQLWPRSVIGIGRFWEKFNHRSKHLHVQNLFSQSHHHCFVFAKCALYICPNTSGWQRNQYVFSHHGCGDVAQLSASPKPQPLYSRASCFFPQTEWASST